MNCVNAGNVLVHLFLQTKTHYSLSNQKLQYLLIIAQLVRLSFGRTLFEDDIKNYKHTFVLDSIGNNFMSGADIVSGTTIDMPISSDKASFVLPFTKKKIYEITDFPSDEDKDLLIKVFLAFGAYSENRLCGVLRELKVLRSVPVFSVVPQDKISSFLEKELKKENAEPNIILSYIKERYLEHIASERSDREEGPIKDTCETEELGAVMHDKDVSNAPQTAVCDEVQEDAADGVEELPPSENGNDSPAVAVPSAPSLTILSGLSSLKNIIAGKRYSVLVELASPQADCQLSVVAQDSMQELPLVREHLFGSVYRFSFDGVASDIIISARVAS